MDDRCVTVYDKNNNQLAPCTKKVAWVLINRKRAILIKENVIKIILDKKDLKTIRKRVIKRDNRVCLYCGHVIPKDETATVDHLNPKHITRDGDCGYDTEENMSCCCLKCNNHKGDMPLEEYLIYRYALLLAYNFMLSKKDISSYGECAEVACVGDSRL